MQIVYSKQAVKYIEVCDKQTKLRIKRAIEMIPLGDIVKLKGYDKWYRLRVGKVRIIFEYNVCSIYINSILPRGQVYKGI